MSSEESNTSKKEAKSLPDDEKLTLKVQKGVKMPDEPSSRNAITGMVRQPEDVPSRSADRSIEKETDPHEKEESANH